jgi:predicted Zn-dependent peptidase
LTTNGGPEKTVLDSGLRVVTEAMPHMRSVAVGFWVDVGSRDEPDALSGATHFLEHLLFKGTAERTAQEIAEAVEAVGGEMNAFTAHEYTAYYIRVVDESLDLALDILSDILWRPALRPDEVETEREVILEEIRMRDDNPEELVHDLFGTVMFPASTLGREVTGTPETIAAMSRDGIAGYHDRHYAAGSVVVAAAGNVDHARLSEGVDRRFAGRPGGVERPRSPVETEAESRLVHNRPVEQAHVCLGVRGFSRDDPDRYALSVLNQALGGGMASRLFQEVREKRGLAYSVYSWRQGYQDTGVFGAYAGTAPHQARDVVKIMHDELDRLVADGGLPDDEVERAKGAIRGGMALSFESAGARMNRIGRAEIGLGEVPSVDDVLAYVEAVTPDDVTRVVQRTLVDANRTLAVVGPFDEDAFTD